MVDAAVPRGGVGGGAAGDGGQVAGLVSLLYIVMVMEVTRYRDNPLVVAMDLRNELRAAHHHYPTWGDGQVGR